MRWNIMNHPFKIWISILFYTHGCLGDRSNATSTSAEASEPHNPPRALQIAYNNHTAIQDPCARLPLTPELWKSLELDNYLRTYPSGNNLTLEMYAESLGATNFLCGIGNMCNANQICMPVRGLDWYILVAVQNWNAFSNMMYDATGYAISILQGLVTSIVNDIVPHVNDNLAIESTLLGLLAGLCGAIPGFLFPESLQFLGSKMWPFVQGGTGLICGLAWTYHNVLAMLPADEFSKTTDISYLLSKAQASTQGTIANSTAAATRLGISSPEGLYGVLKDGLFLNNHFSTGELSEGEIQSAILRVARARLFAAIWKAKEKCTQEGPNGAISGKDVLSYCDSEGMMMNIVCSQDDKLITEFHWAYLVNAKYNITTEYVVKHSWECQKKYLTYAYDPYQNSILPADPDAECIVSLAVCDLTRQDIHDRLKKDGILKACREVGQLPNI